ncbi:MAG TPA: ferrous iron transporter B, partial [Verrucomicrobiae bacterium]|nr:ferrous iron transporter B [Verrucomicrobiae bacterium]
MADGPSILAAQSSPALAVLTGNPNCGKTTIFNALTGLRAKVGNYAGVTVERKEGRLLQAPADCPVTILDLPGTYSLHPQSLDEQIARDVLLQRLPDVGAPVLVIVVVDASNLERNLYYATQVIELGYPTVVALNMIDVARENGHEIDLPALESRLGTPVVSLVASQGDGIAELRDQVVTHVRDRGARPPLRSFCDLPPAFAAETARLATAVHFSGLANGVNQNAVALLLLGDSKANADTQLALPPAITEALQSARERLEQAGVDWRSAAIEARYATVTGIHAEVTTETGVPGETFSDKLDRVLTHKVWGTLIFVALMALMFQSIFSFARIPMDALQALVDWFGQRVAGMLGPGDLNSLLVDGVIAGVGAVIVFLPQILL